MRVLVTGAAGFIGSTVVDRLLSQGHQVTGVDDLSRGRMDNLAAAEATNRSRPGSFSFAANDVGSAAFQDLVAAVQPQVVCHLAAQVDVRVSVQQPGWDTEVNVGGTVNVAEAGRRAGVAKVVFASSAAIYGQPDDVPVREDAPYRPVAPYGAAKAAGELYLAAFRSMYGLSYTALALGNVYGPRQDPFGEAGVVAIFTSALLCGRPTRIFGDGTSVRDYVFVGDVAEAFVLALGAAGEGQRLNVATGVATSVRRLHEVIAEAAGAPDEPTYGARRLGELPGASLDCSAAARVMGWRARTDLVTGVGSTVGWVREQVSSAG